MKEPVRFRLGLATFGILALELALIRWTSGQIRIFAYFNNLVLIGAFLGLGLGMALGPRHPGLHRWTLPMLLVASLPLAFSGPLDLVHMSFPDASIALWGDVAHANQALRDGGRLLVFLGVFASLVAVFVFAGSAVGELFARTAPLRAYTADLLGSLLGILAITAATAFDAGPPVWLLLGALPFAWLSGRASSWAALLAVVALGGYSVQGALYSPYNRIDLEPAGSSYSLTVNRDFHQVMYDVSDSALGNAALDPDERRTLRHLRLVYDIPFVVNSARDRALVVGAGTGNDIAGALRSGYGRVHSVDIDGRIVDLGRRLHPARPYDDPRVVPVANDARAFFEQYRGPPFDVIAYGLLDSHAMFSALSTLRLDDYVYTEEGIRAAWRHVAERGHLSVSFSVFAGPWLRDRIYWTIARATGVRPVMLVNGLQGGCTYLAARPAARLDLERLAVFERVSPAEDLSTVRTTSDDWPFLYIRPGVFPWGYLVVLASVLLLAVVCAGWAFGPRTLAADFDPVLFLMGAAFLLVETRGVTTLSLLFGSTWMVNAAVFAGIVVMALLANVYVQRFGAPGLAGSFAPLLLSVVLLAAIDHSMLNRLGLPLRGLLGGLLNALPVGFAGVVVSARLARSPNPAAALGSNLLGSVLGGCLEYLSMVTGLRFLALLALALYLGAMALLFRRARSAEPWVPGGAEAGS